MYPIDFYINSPITSLSIYSAKIPKNTDYTTEIKADTNMIAIHFDYPCKSEKNEPFVYEMNNQVIFNLFDKIYEKYSDEDTDNYECYSFFISYFLN